MDFPDRIKVIIHYTSTTKLYQSFKRNRLYIVSGDVVMFVEIRDGLHNSVNVEFCSLLC